MQPLRPQGHLAPPRLTTMWPISPAAPRPSQGLPSRTSPPPTPVPQKTPIRLENSRPAPRWNSASVATWTSLPIRTSVPSASFSVLGQREAALPAGQVLAPETTPVFSSASPGEPTPTPARSSVARPRAAPPPRAAPRPSPRRRPPGRRSVGVGCRASPRTSPLASTIAVWILVPPRSIPPRSAALRGAHGCSRTRPSRSRRSRRSCRRRSPASSTSSGRRAACGSPSQPGCGRSPAARPSAPG